MGNVTARLIWNGELKFTALSAQGFETAIDGNAQVAPSPMALLLEALGGCTAIDVMLILEKMRKPLSRLEVVLDGERNATEPKYYKTARVRFDLWGDGLKADKVERAVNLSFAKYCSVFHSLRPDLQVRAEFRIHATGAEAEGEYQEVAVAPR